MLGIEGVPALRGVGLTIQDGEFISILGTSGGGKTTLLNIIGTIDMLTEQDVNCRGYLTSFYVVMYVHVKRNERVYKEHAEQCWYFYAMTLGFIASRAFKFMESCAHGRKDKLLVRHLNALTLQETIESQEIDALVQTDILRTKGHRMYSQPI